MHGFVVYLNEAPPFSICTGIPVAFGPFVTRSIINPIQRNTLFVGVDDVETFYVHANHFALCEGFFVIIFMGDNQKILHNLKAYFVILFMFLENDIAGKIACYRRLYRILKVRVRLYKRYNKQTKYCVN